MAIKLARLKTKKRDINLTNLAKFYKGLMENKLSVGLHKEQGSHNVEKGFWNEFGATPFVLAKPMRKKLADGTYTRLEKGTILHIPPRPFIRLYLYPEKQQRVFKEYKTSYEMCLKEGIKRPNSSVKKVLDNVGFVAVNEIHNLILSKTLLSNAPLTIAIKGFDFPLFKTGSMVNAIKHKVRKK